MVRTVTLGMLCVINVFFSARMGNTQNVFPSTIDLSAHEYSELAVIAGGAENDLCGRSVCVGDVNNDGYQDIIIGAIWADPVERNDAGIVYIILGGRPLPAAVDIQSDTGSIVKIMGRKEGGLLGSSVAVGDINNDGFDDVILGAPSVDSEKREKTGEVYVIYGKRPFPSLIDLADDTPGIVRISGRNSNDLLGCSVAVGDVNNDKYDDVIVGAVGASPEGRASAGESYIVLGNNSLPRTIDLSQNLSGTVRICGGNTGDGFGKSVAAGDINRDGFDDVVVTASFSDPDGRVNAGEVYVIYGQKTLAGIIDVNKQSSGMTRIIGNTSGDSLGESLCVGDVNNDGYADVISGAPFSSPDGRTDAGEAYIIYGSKNPERKIDVKAYKFGMVRIIGAEPDDSLGDAVCTGEINNDSCVDIIIGASLGNFNGKEHTGKTYIVCGKKLINGTIDLKKEQPGIVQIVGSGDRNFLGCAVACGDINRDGFGDVIVGAAYAGVSGKEKSGKTYIIWGKKTEQPGIQPPAVTPGLPSEIQVVSTQMNEPSRNGMLDAGETGSIDLVVVNSGGSRAHNLSATVSQENPAPGLSIGESSMAVLSPNERKTLSIPVSADNNVGTDNVTVKISLTGESARIPDPYFFIVKTKAFAPSELVVARRHITELTSKPDNMIQPGEKIEVTVVVKNNGQGAATGVSAKVDYGSNISPVDGSGDRYNLGNMPPGAERSFSFKFSASQGAPQYLPTSVLLSEENEPARKTFPLELVMNGPIAEFGKGIINPYSTVNLDELREIDVPPARNAKPHNGVAVVIGNRDYSKLGPVTFAISDAKTVKTYLEKTFGYRNIIYRENTTATDLKGIFGTESSYRRELYDKVEKGVTDVFVYYSGHGAPNTNPDEDGKIKGYLVPVDVGNKPTDLVDGGYPIELLYSNLAKLEAHSLVVVIDACFSGADDARPVGIEVSDQFVKQKNAVAFAACQKREIANSFNERKHGFFTYFFLKAIRDKLNSIPEKVTGPVSITAGEIYKTVSDKNTGVPFWSEKILNGRKQTPDRYGDENTVLLTIE
ncbi:caspase family protein [bacterium]|nr:caspase family protein [bacterium]